MGLVKTIPFGTYVRYSYEEDVDVLDDASQ